MSAELDLMHVSELLRSLGRASTPPVKESRFGLDLHSLLQDPNGSGVPDALAVAAPATLALLREPLDVEAAIPGAAALQAQRTQATVLIIDEEAFDAGPWMGADSGVGRQLADEIFEAGRIFRETGRSVLALASPQRSQGPNWRLIDATTTQWMNQIPDTDLEEHAVQGRVWGELCRITAMREGME